MTKRIKYTMTTKEALLKIHDFVIDAYIPGLHKKHSAERRQVADAEEGDTGFGHYSFRWELTFAIGVAMHVDFPPCGGDEKAPVHPKITFNYSGTHHDLPSAITINELHRRVVTLGAMIDAVLRRETIKSRYLSYTEAALSADKDAARTRYQQHLAREVGHVISINKVDAHDISFTIKNVDKGTWACGARKRPTSASPIPCGNLAKYAIWTGKAWGARCGCCKGDRTTKADPFVDILADYEKDYGKKFLTSKLDEKAA